MANLSADSAAGHSFEPGRAGFLQVISSLVSVEGNELKAGDGLQFEATAQCSVEAKEDATVLLFDLK